MERFVVNAAGLRNTIHRRKSAMKNVTIGILCFSLATMFCTGGCSEESKVQEKTKVSTPEGSTTVSKETKVESTGKNPPAPANP